MKARYLRNFGMFLFLGAAQSCAAQMQVGVNIHTGSVNGVTVNNFSVLVPQDAACSATRYYTVFTPDVPMNMWYGGDTTNYFNLPAGNGDQSFQVHFDYTLAPGLDQYNEFQVLVDGATSPDYYATRDTAVVVDPPLHDAYLTIHYNNGTAYSNHGVRQYTIRLLFGGVQYADIRFRAVMEGKSYTQVLGHYNTPSLPLFILRDPPGDASYGSLTTGSNTCSGTSRSVSNSTDENAWFKVKLGVSGTIGLGVTTDFSVYGEAGVSVDVSQSQTSEFEYQTCLEATDQFTTSESGTPDDMFIGSAVRYAYGMLTDIERSTCGHVTRTAYFASTPDSVLSSYHYNESYIRSTVIPQLDQQIASLTVGTAAYKTAVEQRDVWVQALAMNNTIKATGPVQPSQSFNGGGTGLTHSLTTTTSSSASISYSVSLENGLSAEFGVDLGGSGVSGGGGLKVRNEYGNGTTGSNVSTNTMSYHLEDGDGTDQFVVKVRKDPVFGSYAFRLDSANSRTSCRYEGGYRIDQPSLSVGSAGNNSMTINEAPIGSPASFPLIICNNSDITRTYYLKFNAASNGSGAVLQALGNTLNSTDDGIPITLDGGQCINATLLLSQPQIDSLDYHNIRLYLYSLCNDEYAPYIRSYITVSAYFGPGNFGSYCTPISLYGPSQGDYIDGVQLGAIDNTGSGGVDQPAYTDYTTAFSTHLSRNAQRMITITSGSHEADNYLVWVDWNSDGVFQLSEFLGGVSSTAPHQAKNLPFAVPATATLGSTVLRVRCTRDYYPDSLVTTWPCTPFANAETEDYSVVIDGDTPQDCMGVPNGPALPGVACDDGNALTSDDAWNANCVCLGIPVDCTGIPNGTHLPGTPCDDGDASTVEDMYDANCQCTGQIVDCLGTVGGNALPGTGCNDGDPGTGNDVYGPDCTCAGQLIDCVGTIGGSILPGTACDDGNPLSSGDVYTANCQCAGTIAVDCLGVPGGPAQPGLPCDDNNPFTGNDAYGADCVCAGQVIDCLGQSGGTDLPGTPCDDHNDATTNDVYTADCQCLGQLATDCAGVPGGSAQPGTPCDDGDPATGNDAYNANCTCVGLLIDCTGNPGGLGLPGAPCDDGDASTGNDVFSADCTCAGLLIDCAGIPGGTSTAGTACDDGSAATTNDMYNADCVCAGTLPMDCAGVAGGSAQPGSPCDDGDANTGNDIYSPDCVCAGTAIDCAGAIGGAALPGTTCNDGDACTTGDVWDNNCTCAGLPTTVGAVTSPSTVDVGGPITLFVDPVPGADSYSWDLPGSWTSTNTNSFVLVAVADSTAGVTSVCVNVTVGGCTVTACATVTVLGPSEVQGPARDGNTWFTVSPNPSDGRFILKPSGSSEAPMDMVVYDATGREVMRTHLDNSRATTLDLGTVGSGTYYLLATRNGEQRVLPLVIAR